MTCSVSDDSIVILLLFVAAAVVVVVFVCDDDKGHLETTGLEFQAVENKISELSVDVAI